MTKYQSFWQDQEYSLGLMLKRAMVVQPAKSICAATIATYDSKLQVVIGGWSPCLLMARGYSNSY